MYESFAQVYDTFMDNVPYDEWAGCIIEKLKEDGIKDGLVLDLGCGTGQMTRRLRDAGYDMIGVDGSVDMLQIAREAESGGRAQEGSSDILYLLQDIREFELYGTVRAVISTCDTLNYITRREDLLKVFRLVNNYLDPGGLFLFDINTVSHYAELCADNTFAESRDDCSFIWENEYDSDSGINEYDLTLFLRREDGLYERFLETHTEKAWEISEVRELLEEAGMEYIAAKEAYTDKDVTSETYRVMILARERGKEREKGKISMHFGFTKMHGIGNDYVYVNGFTETVEDPVQAAKLVSDRHFGIGSDGLIIIQPSDRADCEMEMYNADGSRGKMCGNGIRCVGKYVYDHKIVDRDVITVDTLAGIKTLKLNVKDGRVDTVRVDMGAPVFAPGKIPVDLDAAEGKLKTVNTEPYGEILLNTEIPVSKELVMKGTCVSMGNPHCVVPVDDVASFDVEGIGKLFENHPIFPERVNTEFIRVEDRKNIRMRVWERGSGETWACGTGACAVAAACILNGWTDPSVTVHLLGGDLQIEWDREKDTIFMTGPAVSVFDGVIDL